MGAIGCWMVAARKLSHHFLDLIEMCLQKDPKKRPTMEEAL